LKRAIDRGCVKTSLRRFKTALPESGSVKDSRVGPVLCFFSSGFSFASR
jgi:hypothetical protein